MNHAIDRPAKGSSGTVSDSSQSGRKTTAPSTGEKTRQATTSQRNHSRRRIWTRHGTATVLVSRNYWAQVSTQGSTAAEVQPDHDQIAHATAPPAVIRSRIVCSGGCATAGASATPTVTLTR